MENLILYICVALLLVSSILNICLYLKAKGYCEELHNTQLQVDDLMKKLKESENRREGLRGLAQKYRELDKQVPKISAQSTDSTVFEQVRDFMKLFYTEDEDKMYLKNLDRHIKSASECKRLISLLQTHVTRPFMRKLWNQDTPVPDKQCEENVAALVDMAMKAYDMIDSFENPNFNAELQLLNIQLADNTITRQQALDKAVTITDISDETPRWVRVLKASVTRLNLDDKGIIFSGYKL